jgi:uncharacterized membrane protein
MKAWMTAVAIAALALAGCTQATTDTAEPTAEAADATSGISPSAFEGALEAVGPEGAWRLSIAPEAGITLDESEAGVVTQAAYSQPVGVETGVEIGSAPIRVRLTPGPCTNGMAGVTYDWNVQVTRDGQPPLNGCLYRPWTTHIVALLPAVRSCLRLSPGEASVSYLRNDGEGAAFMRIVGETGAELDCTLVAGGSNPQTMPANPVRYAGERDALFFPAPGQNPGGECYAAPEVKDANGAVVGWLADPAGC